jgi:hypothetical protein
MTDLSPAAQAVLDAFENASDGEYVEGVWVVNERTMLAAALRALAVRINGADDIRQDVLDIAAELERK